MHDLSGHTIAAAGRGISDPWRLAALGLGAAIALALAPPARAEVSIGIGINVPGISIGINVPAMPSLVAVPGYPVYYAPQLRANYFFFDGLYWVYERDNWYASTWYNGPWRWVDPDRVPVYLLRVPVRYYRAPPAGFRGWRPDAPPHWQDRWGRDWAEQHRDWDRWNHRESPPRAPVPVYQRQYEGPRYPDRDRQAEIRDRYERERPDVRPRDEGPGPRGGGDQGRSDPRESRPHRPAPPPPTAAPERATHSAPMPRAAPEASPQRDHGRGHGRGGPPDQRGGDRDESPGRR